MPIKWSARMATEAMDMVEEYINLAAEPLEQAKIVATEARKIANLPQYMDERLSCLITDIEGIDRVRRAIKASRESLSDGAAENERKRTKRKLTEPRSLEALSVEDAKNALEPKKTVGRGRQINAGIYYLVSTDNQESAGADTVRHPHPV